tara:strand:+ start:451 stop:597 length:147 start_codon:yes stop_codon:yes gene_type:complete
MKQKDIICIFLLILLIYLAFTPIQEGLAVNSIDGQVQSIYDRIPLFYR